MTASSRLVFLLGASMLEKLDRSSCTVEMRVDPPSSTNSWFWPLKDKNLRAFSLQAWSCYEKNLTYVLLSERELTFQGNLVYRIDFQLQYLHVSSSSEYTSLLAFATEFWHVYTDHSWSRCKIGTRRASSCNRLPISWGSSCQEECLHCWKMSPARHDWLSVRS